jgi:glycerol-3-phosphate acyltransferase PlsY
MLAAMPWTAALVTVVIGYVIGSIPVADLVIGRRTSVDLRTVGDRNPGYWNAKKAVGRRAALPVFVGDAAKGALAVGLGRLVADGDDWWVAYAGAAAAMLGHAWPLFARFRGGRSVLTFAGAVCVLSPISAGIAIALLAIVTAATRSFAWGARVGVFVYPLVQVLVDGPTKTAATGVLMCLIGLRFAMAASSARRDRTDGLATSAPPG